MKENDKDIEKLIDKVMREHVLQTPSLDFTLKVMAQVSVAQNKQVVQYQPLISKAGWMTIFGSILAICIYAFVDATQQASYAVDLTTAYDNKLSEVLATIHFSEATMYAVLVLTFLILIQIPLLKNHFERKHLG